MRSNYLTNELESSLADSPVWFYTSFLSTSRACPLEWPELCLSKNYVVDCGVMMMAVLLGN